MSNLFTFPSEFGEDPEPVPCFVDKLIPQGSLCAIVGAPGDGKSSIAIHSAGCTALGLDVAGYAVPEPVGNLYAAAEGALGIANRMRAFCHEKGRPLGDLDENLVFMLHDPLDASHEALVKQVVDKTSRLPTRRQVVWVDTFAASYPVGYNEDRAEHTAPMMQCFRDLAKKLGPTASVVLIHHTGKNGDVRGSSAFRGALDSMILIERDRASRKLILKKSRDFPEGEETPFTLRSAHGSVVVDFGTTSQPNAPYSPSLTASHRQVLAVLAEVGLGMAVRATDLQSRSGHARSTFFRLAEELVRDGCMLKGRDGYTMTRLGEDLLTGKSHGTPNSVPWESQGPTTLKGGTVGPGTGKSHGSPMGVPRDSGPGAQPFDWSHLEQSA